MDPVILGGIVGGASNLLGSSLSFAGAQQTNKTNKEIAEMNNKTMIQLMREQTKSEQDYNSISAQMARAMAAGVNPMLLAGAQPTSASSAGVPSLDTPVMQNPFNGFDPGGSAIGNSMIQAKQMELQSENIDNAKLQTQIDMLQTVAQLVGNADLTSTDVNQIIRSVMGDQYGGSDIQSLFRDQFTMTRLKNAIDISNVDKDTKKYMYSWLDEITNAEFVNLLADTEQKQTQSKVNRSVSRMNDSKKKEIDQAISNMAEQWKSLNATASMDIYRAEKFAKYFDATVDKLVADADISEQEARYWVWNKVISNNPRVINFGNNVNLPGEEPAFANPLNN